MLLLILYIAVIAADLYWQDRKWLTAVNFALMWAMMGLNRWNADRAIYADWYEHNYLNRREYLYSMVQSAAHRIGLNYQGFLICMTFLFLCIRFYALLRMTKRRNLVLGMWLLFPFLMDIVQLRQFYGMSFVLLGICFLFTEEKVPVIKFLACMAAAVFFQNSTAFYLLLLIPYALREKEIGNRYRCVWAGISAVFFGLYFSGLLPALWNRLNVFLITGTGDIAEAGIMPGSIAVPNDWKMVRVYMAEFVLMFVLMAFAGRQALSLAGRKKLPGPERLYVNWCARVNWLMLPVLPMLLLNRETYRFQHGFLIPFYIMLSYMADFGESRERKHAFAAAGLMLAAFILLFEFSGKDLFEGVFRAAFFHNFI